MVYDAIAYALLAGTLGVAAVTDWRTGRIFNWLTYPAMLLGLAYWTGAGLAGAERGLIDAMIGLAAGILPFAVLITLGGLHGGDMKLMGAVGAVSAMWQVVLATAVYGLLIAGVFAIVIMIRKGLVKQTLGRIFGAAMMKAAKVNADLDERPGATVPFAAAAALGGLLAGAEQMLGLATPWAWLGP